MQTILLASIELTMPILQMARNCPGLVEILVRIYNINSEGHTIFADKSDSNIVICVSVNNVMPYH